MIPSLLNSLQRVWEAAAAGPRMVEPKSRKVIVRTISSYLSFSFYADAGRDYHVWIRGLDRRVDRLADHRQLRDVERDGQRAASGRK